MRSARLRGAARWPLEADVCTRVLPARGHPLPWRLSSKALFGNSKLRHEFAQLRQGWGALCW